ncbi:MAG: trypsin-like serine protease [Holosporaceae bacterium]|nr:MAG: trypsin-like serine protease [Holosporaceae bacterium]
MFKKVYKFLLFFICFLSILYNGISASREEHGLTEDPILGLFYRSDRGQHAVDPQIFLERNKPVEITQHAASFRAQHHSKKLKTVKPKDGRVAELLSDDVASGQRLAEAYDDRGVMGFFFSAGGSKRGRRRAISAPDKLAIATPKMSAPARDNVSREQVHVIRGGEHVEESFVIGAKYKHIENPIDSFYPKVVKLEMDLLDDKGEVVRTYVGSGVMIDEYHVLTAAHNLFYRAYKTGPSVVRVYPGRAGEDIPHAAEAVTFVVHPGYVLGSEEEYKGCDLGLIVIDQPIGAKVGYLPYQVFSDDDLVGKLLHVVGYPALIHEEAEAEGRPKFKQLTGQDMYHMSGLVNKVIGGHIYYFLDTYGGQSGAPVLKEVAPGEFVIVGIHTYGGSKEEGNLGTHLSPDKVEYIDRWKEEYVGGELSSDEEDGGEEEE